MCGRFSRISERKRPENERIAMIMSLKHCAALWLALASTAAAAGEAPAGRARLADNPFDLLDRHLSQSLAMQYFWPWSHLMRVAAELDNEESLEEPKIVSDQTKFQINLLVKMFHPEEVRVRVKNRYVIVEGKQHKSGEKHRFATKTFVQSFALPAGCKSEEVSAILKPNGVLQISAPKHPLPPPAPEREVPIVVLLPEETTTTTTKITEPTTEQLTDATTRKIEDDVKVETSTTTLEQLDVKESNHVGKIRKKELKTDKLIRDNEIEKDNTIDYSLSGSE